MRRAYRPQSRTARRVCCFAVLAIGFSAVGCRDPNADVRGAVRGRVTLDGVPLDQGQIIFMPTAGTRGPAAGGVITNGVYDTPTAKGAAIGTNTVQISSRQKTGRQIRAGNTGEQVDEWAEVIPTRYNTASTLQTEIKKGRNEINFELTTK